MQFGDEFMTYKIVADSSSNLWWMEDVDYACVPLTIRTEEEEYVDNPSLDVEGMVNELKTYKGKSSTACPSVGDWLTAFEGADRVFAVAITSGLSGSYNAAVEAAKIFKEENPEKDVCVIDSLSAGPELELIIEKLQEMVKQDLPYETICTKIAKYQRRIHLLFSLESVNNLARNGRVSPVVAKMVGLLGIRIVGKASHEGTLETMHKCRGEKNAIAKLWESMREMGFAGAKVRISHCLNKEAAERLKEIILSAFPKANIRICACTGLCSFYAEKGGLMIGFEQGTDH